MLHYRQARKFLDLRLMDVTNGTGISVSKLAAAERGQRALTAPEECLLHNFLKTQLEPLRQSEEATEHVDVVLPPLTGPSGSAE
jgi:hypothetical protein